MMPDRIGRPIHFKDGAGSGADGSIGWPGEDVDLSAPYAAWFGAPDDGLLLPVAAAPAVPASVPVSACILDGFTSGRAVSNTETVGTNDAADMMVSDGPTLHGVVDGTGITIGILSDSFNLLGGMGADIAHDLLPDNIKILAEGPAGSADEGRAMAELIHAVAPGAAIDFYTAFNNESDFANGILALANAGCNVIVDDVTYFNEPFFQDGSALQSAVETVTAAGVSYFTAASNEGDNFYQASFTSTAATLPDGTHVAHAENFGGGSALQTIALSGVPVVFDLQWDQAFGTADANRLTMELFNSSNQMVASGPVNAGDPVQLMEPINSNTFAFGGGLYRLAIVWDGQGTAPGLFKYIIYSGFAGADTIESPGGGVGSGSVIGHEMIPAANTVGAVNASDVVINNGTETTPTESFSSVGPGEILFDANGNGAADRSEQDQFHRPRRHRDQRFSDFLRHLGGGAERGRGRRADAPGRSEPDPRAGHRRPRQRGGGHERRQHRRRRRIHPGARIGPGAVRRLLGERRGHVEHRRRLGRRQRAHRGPAGNAVG
jgi:hypothetical protein